MRVKATDPAGKSDSINVVITVTNVNDAPVIAAETADAGLTSKNHTEAAESNAVSNYSATDDEDTNATLQWSLSGDDGDKFTFNPEHRSFYPHRSICQSQLQDFAGLRGEGGQERRQRLQGNGDSHRQWRQQRFARRDRHGH